MERDVTSLKLGRTSYPSSTATKKTSSAKLADLLRSDSGAGTNDQELTTSPSSESSTNASSENSFGPLHSAIPYNHMKSPWNNLPPESPYIKSPWTIHAPTTPHHSLVPSSGATLIGSLVREQGHIYSLAAGNGFLYTGSESKNIHVWRRRQELRGFKSASGLVKAIVIIQHPADDGTGSARVFTGHQDGKIRVWRVSTPSSSSSSSPSVDSPTHVRLGSLPRLWHVLRGSVMPGNYVSTRRNRTALWYRHQDAVSCLSAGADGELLYSGSWDRTLKVWRLEDSTCLESVAAHDDAINAVAAAPLGFCGDEASLVFTGSADGTVKAWRREETRNQNGRLGRGTKHVLAETLFRQDCAVTSLAVSPGDDTDGLDPVLYCGTSDGSVNFWLSTSSGKKDRQQIAYGGVLQGHKLAVLCLAAAAVVLLLSGSADSTICVWRREAGGVHSCLSVLTGHLGPIKCLAVETEADGEERSWVVYSGSLDKSVKVWRVRECHDGVTASNRSQLQHYRKALLQPDMLV